MKEKLFGGESTATDKAASLGFTDARILFFPVKSAKSVFGWVTCPTVIYKFARESNFENELIQSIEPNQVTQSSDLLIGGSNVVLEEFTIEVSKSEKLTQLMIKLSKVIYPSADDKYWRDKLKKDVVVLSDDDFRDFVMHSTEIVTRIRIDPETKTVAQGQLFKEEYLPEDTILYFVLISNPPPNSQLETEQCLDKFSETFNHKIVQLGGNATLGKGYFQLNKLEVTGNAQ